MILLRHLHPLLLLSLLALLPAAVWANDVRVLAIHSYHHDYTWTHDQQEGFAEALRQRLGGRPLALFDEYLDTKRAEFNSGYQGHFYDYLWFKYRGRHLDLVYLTDDHALQFYRAYGERLFPGVAAVFSGVNDRALATELEHDRITGVFEEKELGPNLELVQRLWPEDGRLLLVGDDGPTSHTIHERLSALSEEASGPEVVQLQEGALPALLAGLERSGPGVVLLTTIGALRDGEGHLLPPLDTVRRLTAAGRTVLTMEDAYLGSGALGGWMTSGRAQGAAAAGLAARVLAGEPVSAVAPILTSPNRYIFDLGELERSGLRLPPEIESRAEFVNRPPTWLERNGHLVETLLIALSVLVVAGALVVAVAARRSNRIIRERTRDALANVTLANEYRRAMDVSSIVSKTDPAGVITYVNDAFVEAFGYGRDELIGHSHNVVRNPETPASTYREMWRMIGSGQVWQGVVSNCSKEGRVVFADTTIVPIFSETGAIREFIAIRTDVTALVRQEELLHRQATDALTGLPNRVRLMEDLAVPEAPHFAMIDIDGFQAINDFYGLEYGDRVLVEVAERLRELGLGTTVYRIGGDVFGLVSGAGMDLTAFEALTAAVVRHFGDQPLACGEYEMYLGVTAGLSEGGEAVYTHAQLALTRARAEGKGWLRYHEAMQDAVRHKENIQWSQRLKSALAEGRVVPYFQPIVHNRGEGMEKREALVRMIGEDGEPISPFFFLDVAKRTRQYGALTRTVVGQALEALAGCHGEVSVNLTVEDMRDAETVAFLRRRLADSGLGHQVVLEITESEGIENYAEVAEFVAEMRGFGCKLAIDDFGTGYSNFVHLMELKADYLKIDGSIIKNILHDPDAELIVRVIVDAARGLGMETIAEFVSSQELQDKVTELGVDYSQGFHLGKPEPACGER